MAIGYVPLPPEHDRDPRRGGLWRGLKFLLGAPIQALATEHIARSAGLIGDLANQIKAGPAPEARMRVDDGRNLDLVAMAIVAGVSLAEIHRLLANRRRQTARTVFFYLVGGVGFLALWLMEAAATPAYTSVAYVIGLLAICVAFFLSAFYNALINWQFRTLRLGTAREFLRAKESWWPS
jgi:uncharacterized membrane protein (DUF485 family)